MAHYLELGELAEIEDADERAAQIEQHPLMAYEVDIQQAMIDFLEEMGDIDKENGARNAHHSSRKKACLTWVCRLAAKLIAFLQCHQPTNHTEQENGQVFFTADGQSFVFQRLMKR